VGSGGGGTAGVWTSHTRTSGAGRPHPCLSPPQNHPHPNHEFVDTVRGTGKKLTPFPMQGIVIFMQCFHVAGTDVTREMRAQHQALQQQCRRVLADRVLGIVGVHHVDHRPCVLAVMVVVCRYRDLAACT
jgi:hypothetical protein